MNNDVDLCNGEASVLQEIEDTQKLSPNVY